MTSRIRDIFAAPATNTAAFYRLAVNSVCAERLVTLSRNAEMIALLALNEHGVTAVQYGLSIHQVQANGMTFELVRDGQVDPDVGRTEQWELFLQADDRLIFQSENRCRRFSVDLKSLMSGSVMLITSEKFLKAFHEEFIVSMAAPKKVRVNL